MRRFIAMHESESGFETPQAVQDWIAHKGAEAGKWRVVEILVGPITEQLAEGEITRAREQGFIDGVEMERKLMRLRLGLNVPGDAV